MGLHEDLMRDEGCRLTPYRDSLGLLTTGVGHCLDTNPLTAEQRAHIGHDGRSHPLTQAQAEWLLDQDIEASLSDLDRALPWWRKMPDDAQRALANMAFNLGIKKLLGFKRTLAALQSSQYANASELMLQSLWATQVKARAVRLANLVKGCQK